MRRIYLHHAISKKLIWIELHTDFTLNEVANELVPKITHCWIEEEDGSVKHLSLLNPTIQCYEGPEFFTFVKLAAIKAL